MRVTLALLAILAFAAGASAATMTPMSDSGLAAVTAGFGHGEDELLVETFVIEKGQQYASALNLINAGGPVQVGNNILVASSPECTGILGSSVVQAVINLEHHECAPCDFDDATLETGISGNGQQHATAMTLINTAGSAQVGTNLIALSSCDGGAGVVDSCVTQVVVNGACQTTPRCR